MRSPESRMKWIQRLGMGSRFRVSVRGWKRIQAIRLKIWMKSIKIR